MSDKTQQWDQMVGESDVAFEAFRAYRDQHAPRSIRALERELGKSRSLLDEWSHTNKWDRRVRSFTRHKDRLVRIERRQALLKMAEDHTQIGRSIQAKALLRLQSIDPLLLEPKDIVAFLNLGVKIEREARSYATEDLEEVAAEVEAVKEHFKIEAPSADDDFSVSFDDVLNGQ